MRGMNKFSREARTQILGMMVEGMALRANLSMRMGMRRFTRLTNAFSKKAANHSHALAIYFMHYNFVRVHQTLRCSPAMAAGVSAKLWELTDMVAVLEEWEKGQGQKSN